jgi:hypothetical protein
VTTIFDIFDELRDVSAELTKLEDLIINNPQYPSLELDRASLSKRRTTLEHELAVLSNQKHTDICTYRFIQDGNSRSYPLWALTTALREFQSVVTTAFDAIKTGVKKRARISADIAEQSSFDFGYVFTGSLGFVLTMPNERMLIGESEMDRAIGSVFEVMNADGPERIAELARVVGVPTIRRIYGWAESHVINDLSADIQWRRREELTSRIVKQPPQLKQLKEMIESTSEVEVEEVEVSGLLVGLDTDLRTFHMKFEKAEDIRGALAEEFAYDPTHSLNLPYTAHMVKSTTIHYAYEREETHWALVSLAPGAR